MFPCRDSVLSKARYAHKLFLSNKRTDSCKVWKELKLNSFHNEYWTWTATQIEEKFIISVINMNNLWFYLRKICDILIRHNCYYESKKEIMPGHA